MRHSDWLINIWIIKEFENEFFSTVFTKTVPGHMEFPCDVIQPDLLPQISTSRNQVKDILTKLDSTKSTGVDGISPRVLKECAGKLSYPLTLLFNLSFQIWKVPASWKRANFSPVFKSDAKEKVENYRPISLLNIPAKCQERIVHNAIYSHVAPYLTKWQHVFLRGRSCTTQLVLSHHQWSKALDEGRQVDVIFLDFAKAFDREAHDVLLQKLCNFGISGVFWTGAKITSPTENRESWLTELSEFLLVLYPVRCTSGLNSWPLVFCSFYQWPGLPEVVTPGNTVSLYADDCKTSRVINCPIDHSRSISVWYW